MVFAFFAVAERDCNYLPLLNWAAVVLVGPKSGFFQMIKCDVKACRGDYKRAVLRSQRSSCVDRLGSSSECEEGL
ncbi:hypothetical protein AVEN_129030-1 [Araneus ventricosus]|uniref:Uncharacterized protein n=1 Tax=Araneus ventricosus TaxID=182803 RepID=A0A4Y2HKC6_ARAVE|nr:hypothetical protein AVEN_129030-1 [Araneus ventricosus]